MIKGLRIEENIIEEISQDIEKNVPNGKDEKDDNTIKDANYILDCCKYKDNKPILDGEKIVEHWFPNINDKQVFISYSHNDVETAKKLSRYLKKEKDWDCFIDSEVWGSCYELIMKINNKYNRFPNEENLYRLEACQKTTSDIYLIVTAGINKVIDTCPIFIFIESDNSINNSTNNSITYSPWIMEELYTYEMLRTKEEHIYKNALRNDSLKNLVPNVEISYNVDKILKTMREIKSIDDFTESIYK